MTARVLRCCSFLLGVVIVGLPATSLLSPAAFGQVASSINGHVVDQQGGAITGATVEVTSFATKAARQTVSDKSGEFQMKGLTPGFYRIQISASGFATQLIPSAEVLVNQIFSPTIRLNLSSRVEEIVVQSSQPELELNNSSTGTTIETRQILDIPINGRNYLDLMQLVPGVAINRAADSSGDQATPILGERGGNANYLIDGMPNNNYLSGGAAAQFNQDAILEFQVLTSSYKAEFGHSSGGVINVVSRSGTNDTHGMVTFFHRNYKLDSSNNSNATPFLLRWDPAAQLGGWLIKDKLFYFGSAERIMESRQLNFVYPEGTPDILKQTEAAYNKHQMTNDTRGRFKLDEQFKRHYISEQFNYNNNHLSDYLPLSSATNLPSTRSNIGSRYLMIGGTDSWMIGDLGNPLLVTSYLQYRREPSQVSASHPEAGLANTLDNLFSSVDTGQLFGDLGQVSYGAGYTPATLDQRYWSLGSNATKRFGHHNPKFGYDYQQTHVDGTEATALFSQLFSTVSDLAQYGSVDSGIYYLSAQGGATAADNKIKLRNHYSGLYAQDDWQIAPKLTLNLGIRWDYDSTFPNKGNVSPRIGVAWNVLPKTVIHASYGIFYDHFRLGVARDIPGFGGANIVSQKYLSFPRLFYGNPTGITSYFNGNGLNVPCVANSMTDAQIANAKLTCNDDGVTPLYGVDHLNSVVSSGHGSIASGAVVNAGNVQSLTGLTPDAYLAAAAAAIGQKDGYFTWDLFNNLSIHNAFSQYSVPVTVDPSFKTPYTTAIHFGVEQQLTDTLSLNVDYFHRNINHILGVRVTNLTFGARTPDGESTYTNGSQSVLGYGPWFGGFFDGLTVELKKRMSHHFQGALVYTYAKQWDNMLNSSLNTSAQTNGMGLTYSAFPTDSYVGAVPNYTDPVSGKNNSNSGFIASNGNYIPKAQSHYNGANLDYGPSDLSIPHTFLAHGIYELPYGFQLSSILRMQSGFAYTLTSTDPPDVDGDGLYGARDLDTIRNGQRVAKFVNMDVRAAKTFNVMEKKKLSLYFEMFNLFNNANIAGIYQYHNPDSTGTTPPTTKQNLAGREGQVGLRFTF
ncbi:MAG: TonB-dependent receptor [Edaphobacter sp.]|uniref:TonB-dependent receptor n=1 Tax=Edaphobacter sp. TaxID=1934404 RepID=UPI00238C1C3A|nr:TonB-dependent receptor [Edaphobacter sp.]MDE1175836.1 TonB-dependent receptor [Edaphobacter sp.]